MTQPTTWMRTTKASQIKKTRTAIPNKLWCRCLYIADPPVSSTQGHVQKKWPCFLISYSLYAVCLSMVAGLSKRASILGALRTGAILLAHGGVEPASDFFQGIQR